MSHERSTPASPAVHSAEQFPKGTGAHFARTSGSFVSGSGSREDGSITAFERWAMGRSDGTFRGLAGAAGGFTSGFITCPLDVIKTKLQAQGGFRASNKTTHVVYRGLIGTGRVIWREEGLRGMYRGLGPIILGYLPTWAVWFTVYGRSKEYFKGHFEQEIAVNFWSSIVAGASSTMVTNPIWVIKTRLMSQVSRKSVAAQEARPPWHYTSTLDAARKMYASEGILSFYSGLTPALLGLTHVAVQFPAYEYFRTKFTGLPMGVSPPGEDSSHWGAILCASVISKVMASSATYPHEVIRTRLQTQQRSVPAVPTEYAVFKGTSQGPRPIIATTQVVIPRYKGIITTFKTILREEGWRAFYAGMGTNMMRAVPAATTTMLTYEFVMKQLNHAKSEGSRKSAASSNTW